MSDNSTDRIQELKSKLEETERAIKAWHNDHGKRTDHDPTKEEMAMLHDLQHTLNHIQSEIRAVENFDQNESNNQSTPDELLGDAGKHPGDVKPEPDGDVDMTKYKQHELPAGSSDQQPKSSDPNTSKFEPKPEQQEQQQRPAQDDGEVPKADNSGGIRTIPVPVVAYRAPPAPQQQTESVPPHQAIRAIGRVPAYMDQRPQWRYPSRGYDTNQRGLVEQSYRTYYGM